MTDISFIPKFDSTYALMRNVQASHDATPYRCQSSGNCCTIGLRLHLSECENIANNIKREYWIRAERDGLDSAKAWRQNFIKKLVERMYDATWQETGETTVKCAFWDEYCRIYEYRPMVCRAYSTIMPEDDRCPRQKREDGSVFIFHDEAITKIIDGFDDTVAEWSMGHSGMDFTIYYATGILKYLLKEEDMEKLASVTDPKFWKGISGNPHRMHKENWDDVQ